MEDHYIVSTKESLEKDKILFEQGLKICTYKSCNMKGNPQPIENFGPKKRNSFGLEKWCKDCMKKYHRDNIDSYYKRMKYKINGDQFTQENFKKLYIFQKGKCLICDNDIKEDGHNTHIDHDHKTGEVRGLLCEGCNKMIGFCKEDLNILKEAIKYLEKPQNELYDEKGNAKFYDEDRISGIIKMERTFGTYETMIFCEINSFKYRLRVGRKDNPRQELVKIQWYDKMAKLLREKLGTKEEVKAPTLEECKNPFRE